MYKSIVVLLASCAALLSIAPACSLINEGDPCTTPGHSTCDLDDIYLCTEESEYHKIDTCSSHESCREVGSLAACYTTCNASEIGTRFIHDGITVTTEICDYMSGYTSSAPILTYSNYPCSAPGTYICEGNFVYYCNNNFEYEVSKDCTSNEACREIGHQAACYTLCQETEIGTKYIHDRNRVIAETCDYITGYPSAPVITYSNYPCSTPGTSICEDNFVYYCNYNFEYEVSKNCAANACREDDTGADCYEKCPSELIGANDYSCDNNDHIHTQKCYVFPGYEDDDPVLVYDTDLSVCASDNVIYSCVQGQIVSNACPAPIPENNYKGQCVPRTTLSYDKRTQEHLYLAECK